MKKVSYCPDIEKPHKISCKKYDKSSDGTYTSDYMGTCECRYLPKSGCTMLCQLCGPSHPRFVTCRCGKQFENKFGKKDHIAKL